MAIIDGKKLAAEIQEKTRERAKTFADRAGRPVGLTVVQVGDDPASGIYIKGKKKDAEKVGLRSEVIRMPEETTEDELLPVLHRLNHDPAVDGYIVQLPLPRQLDENRILSCISPSKDVDGFTPGNLGRLVTGERCFVPCTPLGCMLLLDHAKAKLEGARAVMVGRSRIVGKPLALLLLARHATVTMCHSRTRDLAGEVGRADILVAAVGSPGLIRGEWIKEGAVVIDVGMNRLPDGSLTGDVAYEEAARRAAWITPVPGGVGPMTRACLIANAVDAAWSQLR